MFVFLSKIIPPLIYPLGLACILIIWTLLLTCRRIRLQRVLLISAFLLLGLGGNRMISHILARSLEWQYMPATNIPVSDVIVVLGGGTQSGNYPRPMVEVNEAGDRILYAYSLYAEGRAEYLLLSGGNISWYSSDDEPAEDMAFLFELMGVPRDALWLEKDSLNTQENAVKTKEILDQKKVTRIILVTSAIHMPRSMLLFDQLGYEVIPAPTDYVTTQAGWESMIEPNPINFVLNVLPSAENLALTTRSLKEWLGMAIYKLLGWV